MLPDSRIRVLIVDDSAIVRKVLSETLSAEPDMIVVGTAPDPYVARDKIQELRPHVLTLDIEMPRMDGLTFLSKLMQHHPLPVIVISSLGEAGSRAALAAMRLGAVEVLAKPSGPNSVCELKSSLARSIRAAAAARMVRATASALSPMTSPDGLPRTGALIAIGASTGGVRAVEQVLSGMPTHCPPIVIAQHIPAGFSRSFAERLDKVCPISVSEATNGQVVRSGQAVIAPGGIHLLVTEEKAGGYRVELRNGPLVCYQRPSVDVLFHSAARSAKGNVVAALLTGMGEDGADGLAALRSAGARTVVQDEASCVVFGMPRAAIERGAAERVVPLERIADTLLQLSSGVASAPQQARPGSVARGQTSSRVAPQASR